MIRCAFSLIADATNFKFAVCIDQIEFLVESLLCTDVLGYFYFFLSSVTLVSVNFVDLHYSYDSIISDNRQQWRLSFSIVRKCSSFIWVLCMLWHLFYLVSLRRSWMSSKYLGIVFCSCMWWMIVSKTWQSNEGLV